MTTIFETGAPQTIAQVLANKDARAALQAQLVATKAPATIVVAKLNIPGPIKANQNVESGLYGGHGSMAKPAGNGGRVADHLG
ncbi:citrate lyase holo-[acyl-carrier protein] synthase (plasmid) [Comamonas sp. C11]|nr:citrate lyase holo-[acyl-carrier protein] synthase [Comamonas sp. C11]UUC96767.1 citrate lyase holo-[acyl-carrier protein] synthase [Comamonas sp. C11]